MTDLVDHGPEAAAVGQLDLLFAPLPTHRRGAAVVDPSELEPVPLTVPLDEAEPRVGLEVVHGVPDALPQRSVVVVADAEGDGVPLPQVAADHDRLRAELRGDFPEDDVALIDGDPSEHLDGEGARFGLPRQHRGDLADLAGLARRETLRAVAGGGVVLRGRGRPAATHGEQGEGEQGDRGGEDAKRAIHGWTSWRRGAKDDAVRVDRHPLQVTGDRRRRVWPGHGPTVAPSDGASPHLRPRTRHGVVATVNRHPRVASATMASMSEGLRSVSLLGPPQIRTSERTLGFRPDLRYRLLAYLAHRTALEGGLGGGDLQGEGGWVTRDRIAFLFWPDSDDGTARKRLSQLLKRLARLPWLDGLERDPHRLRWRVSSDGRSSVPRSVATTTTAPWRSTEAPSSTASARVRTPSTAAGSSTSAASCTVRGATPCCRAPSPGIEPAIRPRQPTCCRS